MDNRKRRVFAVAVTILIAAGLVVYIFWTIRLDRPARPMALRSSAAGAPAMAGRNDPGNPRRVEVPGPRLLGFVWPPHAFAPPRDPEFYQRGMRAIDYLPPEPLPYARSLNNVDPSLLAWIEQWDASLRSGQPAPDAAQLQPSLAGSRLTAVELYNLGQGIEFVDGAKIAKPLFIAAVERADVELARLSPADPPAVPIKHALDHMSCWIVQDNDWAPMEKLYATLARHEVPGSPAYGRAAFMDASALYSTGRYSEAADVISRDTVTADKKGVVSPTDALEMHWVRGLLMFSAARYGEAIPDLSVVAEVPRNSHCSDAGRQLVVALARTGRVSEAERRSKLWQAEFHPTFEDAIQVASELDAARLKTKTQ